MILEEMNVYLDTPQRYVGNVYDRLLYADQPLGWDILGTRATIEGTTRETFPLLSRHAVPARAHGGRHRRAHGRRPHPNASRSSSAASSPATGLRRPMSSSCLNTSPVPRAHEGLGAGAPHPRSARLPHRSPEPLRAPAARRRARRRDVVSPLQRGAREARPRVLRARRGTRRTRTRERSTRAPAWTSLASTRRSRRSSASCARSPTNRFPADELEKARGYAKGRFVLRLESPQGTIQYGLRREVLEGEIEEPDELLRRTRRGHRRGRPAGRGGSLRRQASLPRARRPVRRSCAFRDAARHVSDERELLRRTAQIAFTSSIRSTSAPVFPRDSLAEHPALRWVDRFHSRPPTRSRS